MSEKVSEYGIEFAGSFTRPRESMVGECVYDEDGNHVGWVTEASKPSCAACPEMGNPDSYISHLQSALKWHDEHVPRPTNPKATCVVLQGKNPPEDVMFVRDGGGVTHYIPEDATVGDGEGSRDEWRSVALGLFDHLEKADLEVAQRWLCENDLLRQEIAYGNAKAATVGAEKKSNPRNYKQNGEPKIPNMSVGADPDWVDWVASLEHREPSDLTEAVKQLMFEAICFGGEMGPNDCGGECCPDEGMVYTNDFINGWVNKIAATVGVGTCHMEVHDNLAETEGVGDVWLECDECNWQMPLEPTTPRFKYCPNCRREVVSE